MAARRRSSRKSKSTRRRSARRVPWLRLFIVLLVIIAGYVLYLDIIVREEFEGKRWALPARVYARPLELYAGRPLTPAQLNQELERLGYRAVSEPKRAGEYTRNRQTFHVQTRGFTFWDGSEPPQRLRVDFAGDWIDRLIDRDSGRELDLARLDPLQIASIYPAIKEDRQLVQLQQVPPLLLQTLLAVEDRQFYEHHGVSLRSLLRATVANVKAGGVVQGGSTLTQQLVKNFFLSNERTLTRKLNEAVMSLLLEAHYTKPEILEAYLNEVYLGQDGPRGIHGFGLASRFYFERALEDLDVEQIALLVGLVKGPSYYDPRKHPQRALERRNLVLDVLVEQSIVTAEQGERAKARGAGVLSRRSLAANAHPGFLDLVRRQLYRDYREEDLTSEGLRIFTTLDPQAQTAAEKALIERLPRLEQANSLPKDSLQGAVIVTAIDSAEVLAVVADRDPRMAGFNRALDAARPIGSLVKPAVYLTALAQPKRYTLASWVEDTPLSVPTRTGDPWEPQNYDHQYREQVLLFDALVHSYNIPTARVGLDVGPGRVVSTLQALGIQGDLNAFPSLMLGAADLSPLDVTRMYQTLAAGGFRSPLRAIRAVLAADGTPLQRYPLEVEQVADAGSVFLVDMALQYVALEGTAASLAGRFGAATGIAGKTGTTDDLRDSWFAGFTGNQLAVVWIGRDDNQPMGLTGSSGAVPVWGDYMAQVGIQPLVLPMPDQVEMLWIDRLTGLQADEGCDNRVQLPFLIGTAPTEFAPCADGDIPKPVDWLRGLFR